MVGLVMRNRRDRIALKIAGLHPVVIETFRKLVQGPDCEAFALNQELINGLFTVLVTVKSEAQLKQIVLGLRAMSRAAKQNWGCPTLAEQLRRLLQHPQVMRALKGAKVTTDEQTMEKLVANFERFVGGGLARSARMLDAKKPPGSLSIDALGFPKRL